MATANDADIIIDADGMLSDALLESDDENGQDVPQSPQPPEYMMLTPQEEGCALELAEAVKRHGLTPLSDMEFALHALACGGRVEAA